MIGLMKKQIENLVLEKIIKKYKLIIVRNKISYEAFIQSKTIQELFITQIVKTFKLLYA